MIIINPYVTSILLFFFAEDATVKEFCLLEAMNRNGLFYFLLANLLTGLVNMNMQTIFASPGEGFTIITVYLATLSVVIATLHLKNITLKFWWRCILIKKQIILGYVYTVYNKPPCCLNDFITLLQNVCLFTSRKGPFQFLIQ